MVIGKDSSFVVVRFNKIMKTTDFFANITNDTFFRDEIFPNESKLLQDSQQSYEQFHPEQVFNLDTVEFPKAQMVVNLNNILFCKKETIEFYTDWRKVRFSRRTARHFLIVALPDNFCLLIEISQEDKNLSIDELSYKYLIDCNNNSCITKMNN